MSRYFSPLRYPGGKARLSPFLEKLLRSSSLRDMDYVEPYAGGAGAGLALLFREVVSTVHINDASPSVFAFWLSVTKHNKEFCERIRSVPLTVEEWKRQKSVLGEPASHSTIDLGFAAFYLNRTNRSGIIDSGGVIGGNEQQGQWLIDARFNRDELIRRIRRVGLYAGRIRVTGMDALELLSASTALPERTFYYLDPPYYHRAQRLYAHWYSHDDHAAVAAAVRSLRSPWVVSYDDCKEVGDLYAGLPSAKLSLQYSAACTHRGAEVVFSCPTLAKGLQQRIAV